MLVHGYGIVLERLKHKDIELLREKRNSEKVRQFMEYRDEITSEMQETWFQNIDNIHNNYCFITVKGERIGVINGAGIDWNSKTTDSGGIFIWEEHWWGTSIPLAAALLMTDTSLVFGLELTRAKILKTNPRAIDFNTRLGYKRLPNQEGVLNQAYELHKADYIQASKKLKAGFTNAARPTIIFEVDDPQHEVEQFFLKKLKSELEVPNEWLNVELIE